MQIKNLHLNSDFDIIIFPKLLRKQRYTMIKVALGVVIGIVISTIGTSGIFQAVDSGINVVKDTAVTLTK